MEERTNNAGQGLGIAALILGIISFVVAFIPCVGIFAIITAGIAIILGILGISQASRANSPHKGLSIGGLVVGIIALMVAIIQIVVIVGISENAGGIGNKIEDIIGDIEKDVLDEFDKGNFRITIEEGDQKVEINASSNRDELLETLDELEGIEEGKVKTDSVKIKK